jgi:hypothetical protein
MNDVRRHRDALFGVVFLFFGQFWFYQFFFRHKQYGEHWTHSRGNCSSSK